MASLPVSEEDPLTNLRGAGSSQRPLAAATTSSLKLYIARSCSPVSVQLRPSTVRVSSPCKAFMPTSGQNAAPVDGENRAGDEAVLHQVEVGGSDLVRVAS